MSEPMKVKVEIEVQDIAEAIIRKLTEDGTLAEVKHGEWKTEKNNGLCYCTICDTVTPVTDAYGEYCGCPNYCPNCGAKMDGGEDDDER